MVICRATKTAALGLTGLLALVVAGPSPAQAIRQQVFDQVAVAGDMRCARLDIALALPFVVVGHLPDTATRHYFLFVRTAPAGEIADSSVQGRESAAYPRKANPWLENVSYIGDVPGLQILVVDTAQPALMEPLARHDPRAVALRIATPDNEQACRAAVDAQSQP